MTIARICDVLFWPSLVLAWADGIIVAASVAGLPTLAAQAALAATVLLAGAQFVLMLFDGATHRALSTYNQLVLKRFGGGMSREEFKTMRRQVFASLSHARLLTRTNGLLAGEMMLAAIIQGRSPGPPKETLLAFFAFFLATLITLLQMKTVPILARPTWS